MTEKSIFVYKLFLSDISFKYFLCIKCPTPPSLKKVTRSLPAAPSKNWGPVKHPFLKMSLEAHPSSPRRKEGVCILKMVFQYVHLRLKVYVAGTNYIKENQGKKLCWTSFCMKICYSKVLLTESLKRLLFDILSLDFQVETLQIFDFHNCNMVQLFNVALWCSGYHYCTTSLN